MDNRPIGIFDSGLGGLTTVKEMWKSLPGESIVYFGDTGRVPYGTKSKETVIKYAKQDLHFLLTHNLKAIIVACGTVSSVAIPSLRGETDLPIVDVVRPASKKALHYTKSGKIGVLGTGVTIRSESYANAIKGEKPDTVVYQKVCPMFVPLVENGYIDKNDPVLKLVVNQTLSELHGKGIDTLILGCTHYPIIADAIGEEIKEAALINPGKEAVYAIKAYLAENNAFSNNIMGKTEFFVSDNVDGFTHIASIFLGKEISGSADVIDIDRF